MTARQAASVSFSMLAASRPASLGLLTGIGS
jgi:hypothetical protein